MPFLLPLDDGEMVQLISNVISICFDSIVFKYISIFQMLIWYKLMSFHQLLQNSADQQQAETSPVLFQFA